MAAASTATQLNHEFAELVKDERRLTRTILELIAQFDRHKYYAELGYTSVMTWLIEEHGYSKSAAYRRMQAARLIRSVPGARESLEAGKVNITTLSALQTAIRQEEMRTRQPVAQERKEELIQRIEWKPSNQAGRVIANEFPELREEPIEVDPPTAEPVEQKITIVLTRRHIELLDTVKGVAPEHVGKSLPELIEFLAQKFIKDVVESEKPKGLRVARSAAEPKEAPIREIAKQVMFPHGR